MPPTDAKSGPKISKAMITDTRLFRGMDDATLELLASNLPVVSAQPGEMLVREGELASELYVVLFGEVEVLKQGGDGADVCVAVLGSGDWFGEMAVLDVQPRSASIRTLAPTTLITMSAADVDRLLRARDMTQFAVLVSNVARELSRRLRVADGLIAQSAHIAEKYVEVSRSLRPGPG